MTEYSWTDLHIGLSHGFEWTFSPEAARSFAALSGDTNPLHVDRDYAISAGFPDTVLFGMLTSSLYSQLVGLYLPGKHALLQGIDIDFSAPCFAGDHLRVTGEIVFLSDAFRRLEVKANIRNSNGKLVSKAMIRSGFLGS